MKRKNITQLQRVTLLFLCICCFPIAKSYAQLDLSTDYFKIHIDNKGFITSMKNISVKPNREFSPADKPSPLMRLYDSKKKVYYEPQKATYNKQNKQITLKYSNGSTAQVSILPHSKYIKLKLISLAPRQAIDAIEWGYFHTTITNLFGEILGVARDTSNAVNYSIGAMALNDYTTSGPASQEGDWGPFHYVVHSPDQAKYPLPKGLKEGAIGLIGGNGINDGDFYCHPEEYWRLLYGDATKVDSAGMISFCYRAYDRRKPKTIYFSLMPNKDHNFQRHMEVPAIPDVDLQGSSIALWGSPDSTALLDVIQNIVLSEKLPYPTIDGKWIKDPSAFKPDILWYGKDCDSAITYAKQLGFKSIQHESLGEFYPNIASNGVLNNKVALTNGTSVPIKTFTEMSNKEGITYGLHWLLNFLQNGISREVSPIPNDSLAVLLKRKLANNINLTDTTITVNDNLYLDEVGGFIGNSRSANVIRIGQEIIYYTGVTKTDPYTLTGIKRGYWSTTPSAHQVGDTIYKLQSNCYNGLAPDIFLQDRLAVYYAQACAKNGMHYIDFDGEEGFVLTGHGQYGAKRFFRKFFETLKSLGVDYVRVMGACVSEGDWHYNSVWNVGGGYNVTNRTWGISTKDMRNVMYANYFPVTFGGVSSINKNCNIQDWENLEAISVGLGGTYYWSLSKADVEKCPQHTQIFGAIRTWENARAANAFPRSIKKLLADAKKQFHLEQVDQDTWKLFPVLSSGSYGTPNNADKDKIVFSVKL